MELIEESRSHADSLRVVMQDQAAETIESLCDALEAAQSEIERLKLVALDQWAQKTTVPVGASPAQPSQQDIDLQAFINTLTDPDDKMFEQIELWTRQSYAHHKSRIGGQQITAADSVDSHRVWAALRWAKEYGAQPSQARELEQPRLTVRLTSFPESNGKRNWTALLVRVDKWDGLVGNCGGISLECGELWNRVAWGAECARFLIGERDTEPFILDYGDDIHTPEEWGGEVHESRRVAINTQGAAE